MKRIICVITALALALVMVTPVFADGEITADEVRELMEKSVFLSTQEYCDDVLNTPVQNPDDIFENKKLGEFIDADRTVIEEIQFNDDRSLKLVYMYAWDENGKLSHILVDHSARTDHSAIYGARESLSAYIYHNIGTFGEGFPTSYLDYEKTAEILNGHGLKNITRIAFKSFAMGLDVTADGEEYWVTDLYCMTPKEWMDWDNNQMAQQETERQTAVDKKRAVTPQEYQCWLVDEYDDYAGEVTELLKSYEGFAPQFTDLGDDTFLINASAMLKDLGIISGYEDGTFRPDSTITRGEASAVLSKLVKGEDAAEFDFPDTQNHWSREAVSRLAAANVIHGCEDGTFRPDDEITYGQAIILVYEILGYEANFYDGDRALTLMRRGVFNGVDSFTPEQPISRGNFAKVIANALDTPLMTARADFRDIEPSFYWNYDAVTLGMYLEGIEPVSGVYYVSREEYENWENSLKEVFEALYKDLK